MYTLGRLNMKFLLVKSHYRKMCAKVCLSPNLIFYIVICEVIMWADIG